MPAMGACAFLAAKCAVKQVTINRSCETKATGYAEDLPGGIGGLIACEIHDCGGDLPGQSDSAQGDMTQKQIAKFLGQMFLHSVCGSHTGQYCIAPNVMANMSPYSPTGTQTPTESPLYQLLATYLPVIASGEHLFVELDVNSERLFRVVQTEQRRNTQLVGANA